MNLKAHKRCCSLAFTLVEVVVAIAIIAITIPAILGTLSIFADISRDVIDRGNIISQLNKVDLYLTGKEPDSISGNFITFEDVYGWVYDSREEPENPEKIKTVYLYKYNIDEDWKITIEPYTGLSYDAILAFRIYAPGTHLLPVEDLPSDPALYEKYYLPIICRAHSISSQLEEFNLSNYKTSYPLVIGR